MELNENEMEAVNYLDQTVLDYKQGSSRLEKRMPEMVQGYFSFTDKCFQEGTISEKHKQLIALAISISTQNEYCIIYHTKGAVEHGATEEELMEVIGVSTALHGGSAFSQGVTLTLETFDFYTQQMY